MMNQKICHCLTLLVAMVFSLLVSDRLSSSGWGVELNYGPFLGDPRITPQIPLRVSSPSPRVLVAPYCSLEVMAPPPGPTPYAELQLVL